MSASELAIAVLLTAGVAVVLLSCVGVLVMPRASSRLHYIGPASTLGVVLIAAAVLIEDGLGTQGIRALLISAVLIGAGPIATHATGRAMRIRAAGEWNVLPSEQERNE